MTVEQAKPRHPGAYVRENVIPKGVSVSKAAEMLGVSRPTLSNFLNGKSKLSPTMALRLQKAFGADREALLQLQAAYDGNDTKVQSAALTVGRHVPSFLKITATELEQWASEIDARSQLPVLLRKLVHTAASEISAVDFPGFDNAQRHGWDGWVEADAVSAWVPSGKSGWEFGCDQRPSAKAEADYAARTEKVSAKERSEITFVFVTPRNWPGKTEWAQKKSAENSWKAVRAYDASDLEQWVEQSVPAQAWLGERFGRPARGIVTIGECWNEWAGATSTPLVPELFAQSIEQHTAGILSWLKESPQTPRTIAADSKIEGLAFLASLFSNGGAELQAYVDQVVVVRDVDALRRLASSQTDVLLVIDSDEIERQLGGLVRQLHTIIVRLKNVPADDADIRLDILPREPFRLALEKMGFRSEEIDSLQRESGGSPTVLRRRLATNGALKRPVWAEDSEAAQLLTPISLIGNWITDSEADRRVLTLVSDHKEYDEIERAVMRLRQLDDPPVWAIAESRGVVSKIDAIYAIAHAITEDDLKRFFAAARLVLSEEDPSLDLPEDRRWAAGVYGKVRAHSGVLRQAVCETLVLLAVHGPNWFGDRLSMNVGYEVEKLIRELLTPFSAKLIESQQRDLPHYAEAAPEVFLDLMEKDLRKDSPELFALLRPADSGVFSTCPRTGLLWALETLAWNPVHLPRVVLILARLSEKPIEDNWVNNPHNTLTSIFRSWMPQTAASLHQRKDALDLLIQRYAEVGWKVCVDQFETGPRMGHYNVRPQWRSDSTGAGHPVTFEEMRDFAVYAFKRCVEWPHHDEDTLADLARSLSAFDESFQEEVWDLVDEWAHGPAHDDARASLREAIRRACSTRRAKRRGVSPTSANRAKRALELLQPSDVVVRHKWLFAKQWVEESADEIEEEDFDWESRDKRIAELRRDAVREILSHEGVGGLWRLSVLIAAEI
ncbi:HigA family addiction module antitoxin [Tepidicaulis sp.]|uniref:HigA family addiction module antitoxin n=1 Tax=Tepidicaulis sp. TaxID=1920809 RepID=UPI003B5C2FD9